MDPNVAAPEASRLIYDRPAAVYARLSKNQDGTEDSVDSQVASANRRCGRIWPQRPLLVFADDGIKASDDNVRRPRYEALLAVIHNGEVGDVYTRMQSRITRLPGQWSDFRKICYQAGITELHTARGSVGLAPGQALAGKVQNIFDEEFTEMVKFAVRDTLDVRAEQGRPHGGRPYGYRHIREVVDGRSLPNLEIIPEQAAVVVLVAELVLKGWSLANITRELARRGVSRRYGDSGWSTTAVKRIVTNPAVAGLHTRHGELTGRAGTWEPILDRVTYDAVQAVLERPRRVRDEDGRERTFTGTRVPARRYILSGIVECALCGTKLLGQRRVIAKTGPTFHYVCSSARSGCGKVSTIGPPLEDYVVERFFAFMAEPAFLDFLAAGDADAAKREALNIEEAALKKRRRDLGRSAATGGISVEALEGAEAGFAAKQKDIDTRRAQLVPLPLGGRDPAAIVAGWDQMTLDERRACLFDAGASVRLRPANGRRGFSPERVDVSFGHVPAATARRKPSRKRSPMASKASRGRSLMD